MPKVEPIVGEGPELAESQRQVLEVLEKHPDYLFGMNSEDLGDLLAWLGTPETAEPPKMYPSGVYTIGTMKWAISTLHARRKIGSIKLHRKTYYGSHEAIRKAGELASSQEL